MMMQDKHLRRGVGEVFFFSTFVSESFFTHENEYKVPLCKKQHVLLIN